MKRKHLQGTARVGATAGVHAAGNRRLPTQHCMLHARYKLGNDGIGSALFLVSLTVEVCM